MTPPFDKKNDAAQRNQTSPDSAAPSLALAESVRTPEEALKKLLEGNKRFVAGTLTSFEQDLAILRQRASETQHPFAEVLS